MGKSKSHSQLTKGAVDVRGNGHGMGRVVPISSPFATLTFPSSEESRVLHFLLGEQREFSSLLIEAVFDPGTFCTISECHTIRPQHLFRLVPVIH